MLIVYGTRNIGRQNGIVRQGTCSHCGAFGPLKSFDTAKWFSVYWLPFIPLGRKRVIDACPHCKMQAEVGLRKYRKEREKALRDAVSAMRDSPDDSEAVSDAIGTFIGYNDVESFHRMAPVLSETHGGNISVQQILAEGHEYFGEFDQAEVYRRKTIEIAPSSENRMDLAANLAAQGKLDDISALVAPALADKDSDCLGAAYYIIATLRDAGRVDDATRLMDQIEATRTIEPDNETHPAIRESLVEAAGAQAVKEVSAPQNSPTLQPLKGGAPLWLGAVLPILLVVAGLVAYVLHTTGVGYTPEMYLANGTSRAYTAVINGEDHRIRPYGTIQIEAPIGDFTVGIKGTMMTIPEMSANVTGDSKSRPKRTTAQVINPDQLAIMVEERTYYSDNPDLREHPDPYTLRYGKLSHVFNRVDYRFREFPDEISVSSGVKIEKTRLSVYRPEDFNDLLGLLYDTLSPEELKKHVTRRALFEPENAMNLYVLNSMFSAEDADELIAILRTGLAQRPVLIDWHRLYQGAMENNHPEHDLIGEYRALLDQHPEDSYFRYLLGRVVTDRKEARELFLSSESDEAPIGLGYNAVAYADLCEGRFNDALVLSKKAIAAQPNRIGFDDVYHNALTGTQAYDALLTRSRAAHAANPIDTQRATEEITYLRLLGRTNELHEVLNAQVARVQNAYDSETGKEVLHYLHATDAILQGDVDAYLDHLKQGDATYLPYHEALLTQDAEAVAAYMTQTEAAWAADDYLLAYCVAVKAGQTDLAKSMLEQSIPLLDRGNVKSEASKMLEGDSQLIREALATAEMLPAQKSVVAAAIGLANAEVRDQCFAIARTHNIEPGFRQTLLTQLMAN